MTSGVWTLFFMNGLCTGAPTVFIPQIRKANPINAIDDELASWFYTLSNFAAMPWIFILPTFAEYIGRKIPYLVACIAMVTCNLIMYFSKKNYHILTAQVIQGFINASNLSIIFHIIPEYVHPKYRSMYLNNQSTSFYWGMWISNAIGTYVNWRYIPALGVISSIYSVTVVLYPESSHWLASKGKFKECETAFRWLRGSTRESERELRELMKYQTEDVQNNVSETKHLSRVINTAKRKEFYLPLVLAILVGAQYNFSGKFVCSIYAIDIIKKITENEDAAYTGMLILDGATVVGMYMGCILSKFLKMRTLYLRLAFLSIFFMFSISLYLYLATLGIVPENNIASLCFLVAYSLTISTGPIIQCLSIYSEVILT